LPLDVAGRFSNTNDNDPTTGHGPQDLWSANPSVPYWNVYDVNLVTTGTGFLATDTGASLPSISSSNYSGFGVTDLTSTSSVISQLENPSNWSLSGGQYTLLNPITVADYDLFVSNTEISVGNQISLSTAVPEPATVSLLVAAAGTTLVLRRRRRRR
jgi:hypothetical protein